MKKPVPKTTLVRCFFIQYRNLSAALSVFFSAPHAEAFPFSLFLFLFPGSFLPPGCFPAPGGSPGTVRYIVFSLPPVFLPVRRTVPPHFSPAFPRWPVRPGTGSLLFHRFPRSIPHSLHDSTLPEGPGTPEIPFHKRTAPHLSVFPRSPAGIHLHHSRTL